MAKTNFDNAMFQSKQSTDVSQTKDELKAEHTLKCSQIADSNG